MGGVFILECDDKSLKLVAPLALAGVVVLRSGLILSIMIIVASL